MQPNDVVGLRRWDRKQGQNNTRSHKKLIRGPKGSEVKLVIRRGGSSLEVKLTRDTIPNYSVTSNLDEQDIRPLPTLKLSIW